MHTPIFEPVHCELLPSVADRTKFGHGAMFGSFANHRKNRRNVYESDLELKCQLCLLAQPDVVDVREQFSMLFLTDDGKEKLHFWDALTLKTDGSNELIYMKPLSKLIGRKKYDEFIWLADRVDPEVAASARVMSEWNLDPYAVDTAALYNQACRLRRPALADWVTEVLASAGGSGLVGDICERHLASAPASDALERPDVRFHRLMSEAYWAVVWLLANHSLHKSSQGFVSTCTRVSLPAGRA